MASLARDLLYPPLKVERERDGGHDQARLPRTTGHRPGKDNLRLARTGRQNTDDGVPAAGRADRTDARFLPRAQVVAVPGSVGVEEVRGQLPVGPAGRAAGGRLVRCNPLGVQPCGQPRLGLPLLPFLDRRSRGPAIGRPESRPVPGIPATDS